MLTVITNACLHMIKIAMSCSGTNAYRHGTMKNWVISVTTVLADGTIVKTRQRPRKSSAGYDLTSLLVGSEGTLGLVTEAVLKVTSWPENQHVVVAAFPNTHAAVEAAIALITQGILVDALELLDRYSLTAINKSGLSSRPWRERPSLFLKFSGSAQAVQEQLGIAKKASRVTGCENFETFSEQHDIRVAWDARKQVGPSLMAMKQHPSDLFLNTDAAVPISSLAYILDWTEEIIAEAGLIGSTLGHVGDGTQPAGMFGHSNTSPGNTIFITPSAQLQELTISTTRQLPRYNRLPQSPRRIRPKYHHSNTKEGNRA